jgi:hypothetical protein
MAIMDGLDHVLVASPSIKRVEDLKGKTIIRYYGLDFAKRANEELKR